MNKIAVRNKKLGPHYQSLIRRHGAQVPHAITSYVIPLYMFKFRTFFDSSSWKEMAGATVPGGSPSCLAGDVSKAWRAWWHRMKAAEGLSSRLTCCQPNSAQWLWHRCPGEAEMPGGHTFPSRDNKSGV